MTSISIHEHPRTRRVERALDLTGGVVRVRPENRLRAAARWVAGHMPAARFRHLDADLTLVVARLEADQRARREFAAQLAALAVDVNQSVTRSGERRQRIEQKLDQATAHI